MNRRISSAAVALVAALGSIVAVAQAPPAKPAPGPEHKKLAYFVGTWKGDAELKPNPYMPGGTYTSTDRCEWFDGNFAVVCRGEGNGPMGPVKSMGLMGYNTDEKVYTYYGLDSAGMTMASVARGKADGSTWTYTEESTMGGKPVKSRYTIRQLSPTSYSFTWETQGADGKWTTLMEGRQNKQVS